MVRIQNMRSLAFKLIPSEFFEKLIILSKIDESNFFEKCVLELCRTAMFKPRQIESSVFFLLDHNGQTQIYRLVSGQPDEHLLRKGDFPMKDDDCPWQMPPLTHVWIRLIPGIRKINHMCTPTHHTKSPLLQRRSYFLEYLSTENSSNIITSNQLPLLIFLFLSVNLTI